MSDEAPPRILFATFYRALVEAGVLREGEFVRRVVIDAEVGAAVVIHVERYGDTRLLNVVRTLEGVEVREQYDRTGGNAEKIDALARELDSKAEVGG